MPLNAHLSETLLDQAAEALFQLGRLFGRIAVPTASTASPRGVELSRILVVQAVEAIDSRAAQPATVGAIGQRLAIDPSTASRLVADAIKDGYLLRSISSEDGRRVHLALSDTGRALAHHARVYQHDVFRQVTSDWTEAERTAFAGLFIRFTEAVTTAVQAQTASTASQQGSRNIKFQTVHSAQGGVMDDLIEMWGAHSAIDLYLLNNLPENGLDAVPTSGGMTVGQQFAHINDLRLRWAHNAAPDLIADLPWFERQPDHTIDLPHLQQALQRSGEAIEALIRRCVEMGSGVKDFPGSPTTFLGYLISHESYHWGEIGLALTQSGHPLDKDVALGIWRGWWGREPEPRAKEQ